MANIYWSIHVGPNGILSSHIPDLCAKESNVVDLDLVRVGPGHSLIIQWPSVHQCLLLLYSYMLTKNKYSSSNLFQFVHLVYKFNFANKNQDGGWFKNAHLIFEFKTWEV